MENKELALAHNFIEKTDRNVFLTGKAGTGKTTFLHQIKKESNKRLIVVAPTGVAAINAKGVTIHSFFQMAFGPIIPGVQVKEGKFKFGKAKLDIMRSLDLLIIDEISMVRADLLDGIDQVLRKFKDRTKVFGGVQVLMIGDLQQLAPVVKPAEWDMLSAHYETPYFFSSKSFINSQVVNIELKHIYRQDNQEFITILNEIRNNNLSAASEIALNKQYNPNFIPKEKDGYITLTTHNQRANNINQQELNTLTSKANSYTAKVTGKFNEYAFPTHKVLQLKIGAQVMFIKNDSSADKRYYNGKIGTVTSLSKDKVVVKCPGDTDKIETGKETWENITYSIDALSKEIKEDLVGSFSQIPLRLAWAITIHKSQGLTFERAIIDAEASFAHGQTYVALSRCKTLDGIVLKSKISKNSIIKDTRVSIFTKKIEEEEPTEDELKSAEKNYQLNLVSDLFNYHPFLYPVQRLITVFYQNRTSLKGTIIEPLEKLKDEVVIPLLKVSNSFKNQLAEMSEDILQINDNEPIQKRIHQGIAYFLKETQEKLKKYLDQIKFSTDNQSVKKDMTRQIEILEDLLQVKLTCLNGLKEKFTSESYLILRTKALLDKTNANIKKPRVKREPSSAPSHPILFEELRQLRLTLANKDDVAVFQVYTQQTLFDVCTYLPTSKEQLMLINGMGKVRVQKYGSAIVHVIIDYCKEHNIDVVQAQTQILDFVESKPKKAVKNTKQKSLDLFKSGKSIDQIAKERELTKTTIEGHLTHFLATNEIKINDLISSKKVTEITKKISKVKFESLSDLRTKLNNQYSYSELKIVLAILQKK